MVFPKARLVVAALLFVAWLGFLAYLVLQTRDLIVVSRPQILVSQLCILAQVDDNHGRPSRDISVAEVLWSESARDSALAGRHVALVDLPDIGAEQGYGGAGTYLIPLIKLKGEAGDDYRVTPLPPMPGFLPRQMVELIAVGEHPDAVAALIAELTEWPAGDAKTAVESLPRVLARNLTWPDAEVWRSRLSAIGATVRLADGEIRIYRATEDVLARTYDPEAGQKVSAASGRTNPIETPFSARVAPRER